MSDANHTPGPWEWHGQFLWEKLADDVRGDLVGAADIANEADRNLIEAAPELLEALEDLLEVCAHSVGELDPREPIKAARAAIAKARG